MLKNFLLFLVAIVLFLIFLPIGILYSIFTLKINVSGYFFALAASIDQTGNVLVGPFLNRYARQPSGYKFGNEDQKISYVIAMNFKDGTLEKFGSFLYSLIDRIDPGHFTRIIDKQGSPLLKKTL